MRRRGGVPDVSLSDESGDGESGHLLRSASDLLRVLSSESTLSVRTEEVSSEMEPSDVSKGITHLRGRAHPRRTLRRLRTPSGKGDFETATSSEQRGVVHLFALSALNIPSQWTYSAWYLLQLIESLVLVKIDGARHA